MKTSINTFETVFFIKLIFQRTLILGASLPFSEKYIKLPASVLTGLSVYWAFMMSSVLQQMTCIHYLISLHSQAVVTQVLEPKWLSLIPTFLLSSCMVIGKFPNYSRHRFPQWKNGKYKHTHFRGLLGWVNESINAKHLKQGLCTENVFNCELFHPLTTPCGKHWPHRQKRQLRLICYRTCSKPKSY